MVGKIKSLRPIRNIKHRSATVVNLKKKKNDLFKHHFQPDRLDIFYSQSYVCGMMRLAPLPDEEKRETLECVVKVEILDSRGSLDLRLCGRLPTSVTELPPWRSVTRLSRRWSDFRNVVAAY